jgi:hypothetical protein
MKSFHCLGALILLALAAPTSRGASQVVRGTVTERGSKAAIPGVLVSLLDDLGRTV